MHALESHGDGLAKEKMEKANMTDRGPRYTRGFGDSYRHAALHTLIYTLLYLLVRDSHYEYATEKQAGEFEA